MCDVCVLLLGALWYIHSQGIAHCNLKPENLLIAYRHAADFGFGKTAPDNDSLSTMCGTLEYLTPEVIRKDRYGMKCDMWSMGVIVFILLGGYPPFHGSNPRAIFEQTVSGQFSFDPDYWGGISQSVKDMICSLLDLDPARRASSDAILSHP